jgi:EAL domain-containing protein (putative c-di-GMP-specific phosphodiesterase class I)
MVPPDEFLAAAEEAGLTRRLTARVLAMALGQLSEWCREDRAVPVAVNLAAADLLDPCLPDQIVAALRQEGPPPHLLRLEVTEGSLITEQHRTAEALCGFGGSAWASPWTTSAPATPRSPTCSTFPWTS